MTSPSRLAHGNRQPSATKKGPGRYHCPGHSKASPQRRASSGATHAQETNPRRAWKNRMRAVLGSARKLRHWLRVERALDKLREA